jgi:hypothetical protein
MAGKSLATIALAVASLVEYASPSAAGPISVFTEIYQAGSPDGSRYGSDEIPVAGLGSFAILTSGGGVDNVVTVPADQTSARQLVVGYWPVIGFRDRAQYEAERGNVVTVPETPVSLYVEVHNGAYGSATEVRQIYFDSVVSARISPEVGQNEVDWRMIDSTKEVHFGDTLVSISYAPVRMPDGIPSIFFDDGSPGIGAPAGPPYYPTLLEATIDVTRAATDGGSDASGDSTNTAAEGPPGVPEPASALLLGGFALGGLFARLGLKGRLFGAQKAALHG